MSTRVLTKLYELNLKDFSTFIDRYNMERKKQHVVTCFVVILAVLMFQIAGLPIPRNIILFIATIILITALSLFAIHVFIYVKINKYYIKYLNDLSIDDKLKIKEYFKLETLEKDGKHFIKLSGYKIYF